MIVEPKVREFICTTAHPQGCRENVKEQIAYVKNREYYRRTEEDSGYRSFHRVWPGKQNYCRFRMSWGHTGNYV